MTGGGESFGQGRHLRQDRPEAVRDHALVPQGPEVADQLDVAHPRATRRRCFEHAGRGAGHHREHRRRALGQRVEVVAALEHDDPPAGRDEVEDPSRQRRVVAGGQPEVGDRVVAVGVEAGGDEQPGRGEALDERGDDLVERRQVDVAGGVGRHRHVHRGADGVALAGLVVPAGPGVQRPLVVADEQHPRIGVERGLRAVAVMGVDVDDDDALAGVGQRGGDDRDVGDDAEAHRLHGGGVVARRAHGAERGVAVTTAQRLDRRQPGAGGEPRRLPGVRPGVGVGVEAPATGGGDRLDPIEVGAGVHALQLGHRRRARLERHEGVVDVGQAAPVDHRTQPLGALRMAWPGEVFEVRRMGREAHTHPRDATVGAREASGAISRARSPACCTARRRRAGCGCGPEIRPSPSCSSTMLVNHRPPPTSNAGARHSRLRVSAESAPGRCMPTRPSG